MQLDSLRGLAALWVLLFHHWSESAQPSVWLGPTTWGIDLRFLFNVGWAGVDIFFVLSGFLLTLPYTWAAAEGKALPDTHSYLLRRALRVFPAYYAQLALLLVLGWWLNTVTLTDAKSLFAHLTMFFNVGSEPVRPLVGVWWTLTVEFSFYLLLPLLARLMGRPAFVPLIVLLLSLSLLYRWWAADNFASLPMSGRVLAMEQLPGSLPLFLGGMSAAICYRKWGQCIGSKRGWFLLGGGLVLFFSSLYFIYVLGGERYWGGHWFALVKPLVNAIGLAMIILGLIQIGGERPLLRSRPLVWSGMVSYSVYLWHLPLLGMLKQQLSTWPLAGNFWLGLAVLLIITYCAALISYSWIERPFVAIGRGPR